MKFAIDPASSEFFDETSKYYDLAFKQEDIIKKKLCEEKKTALELVKLYHELLDKYPIILLEDPFAQDDWKAWTQFGKTCPVELVGDDLLATNKKRISMAKEHEACNALLLKINQIGTLTESIEA